MSDGIGESPPISVPIKKGYKEEAVATWSKRDIP